MLDFSLEKFNYTFTRNIVISLTSKINKKNIKEPRKAWSLSYYSNASYHRKVNLK